MSADTTEVFVPAFEPNSPTRIHGKPSMPDFLLPLEEAIALVRDGLGTFINHKKAVRLNESRISLPKRGRSLNVNETIILAYINNALFARGIISGWKDSAECIQRTGTFLTGKSKRIRRRKWRVRDEENYNARAVLLSGPFKSQQSKAGRDVSPEERAARADCSA